MRRMVCAVGAGLLLAGCTGAENSPFEEGTTEVRLIVGYADGAEPYTGDISALSSADTWGLYGTNIGALFAGTGIAVTWPDTLAEMTAAGTVSEETYTSARILELADEHIPAPEEAGVVAYRALWLDGYLEDEGAASTGVIGVSIGDTGVIAMFKPVVAGMSSFDLVRRFSEQTTIIHEVGHALGLVNNGVEMVSDHQDEANGRHCDNERCVMYYANEGAGDLAEFVQQYVVTGEEVIFDDDCQRDVQAAQAPDSGR